MDPRKFASDELAKGTSPSKIKFMLVEQGYSYADANMIVSEALKNRRSLSNLAVGLQKTDLRKFFPAAIIICVAVIGIAAYSLLLPAMDFGSSNQNNIESYVTTTYEIYTRTVNSINRNPKENPSYVFYLVSLNKKLEDDNVIKIDVELERVNTTESFFDLIYVYTDLEESSIGYLSGASRVDQTDAFLHIFNATGSNRLSFQLSGIEGGVKDIIFGQEKLRFGEYHIVIIERQVSGKYNIFGWNYE